MRSPRILLLLATLAAAVYAPILSLPFTGTSFIEIPVSRLLGTWHALPTLLHNLDWHFRITYVFFNSWLVGWMGLQPRPFYIASLCLHAACVLLIYLMGRWRFWDYKASGWAAAFFALYSGHHATVMTLSSWPDLVVTLFACASFLSWIRWIQSGQWTSYVLSAIYFIAALLSNESGFLTPLLFAAALWIGPKASRKSAISLAPFVALSIAAAVVQLAMRPKPIDWELNMPVRDAWWVTLAWTAVVAGCLAVLRPRLWQKFTAAMTAWVIVVLLTGWCLVSAFQLGRQVTYLSSLGLALLFGYSFEQLRARVPARLALAVGLVITVLNVGLLWSVARRQMAGYAMPTQALLNAALYAQGAIRLTCFPFPLEVAEAVAGSVGVRVTAERPDQVKQAHCVRFAYTDAAGNVRNVFMHSAF
jgi:hypothetical protein